MALEKQNVPIAFGQGIDTKNDPKQLMPGKLTVLQNGIFSTGKEIKKRDGNVALTQNIQGGGTVSAGVIVQAYQEELVEADGSSLYSYNASGPNWVNKGSLPLITLTTSTVIRTTTQQSRSDAAINGNLQAFMWFDSIGQLGYSIFDSTTNQSIVNNTQLSATGTHGKVVAFGTKFVFIYYDTGSLYYKTVDITTPTTLSGSTLIASDVQTNDQAFDISVYNSRIYLAYENSSSGTVSMYYVSSSFVLSSKLNVPITGLSGPLTIVGDSSNNSWVTYGRTEVSNTAVHTFVANPNLTATVLAETQLIASGTANQPANIIGVVSGTIGTFWIEYFQRTQVSAVLSPNFIKVNTMTLDGTAGSPSVFKRAAGISSKPFTYNSTNYFLIAYNSPLQNTYFLVNGSTGQSVGKVSPDGGGGYGTFTIPSVSTVSSGKFLIPSLVKDSITSTGGTITAQTGVLAGTFDFNNSASPSKYVLAEDLQVAGAIQNMYDGANVVEHGFSIFPEGLASTLTVESGGIGLGLGLTNGQVQYCAVYEWTDNQGQVHLSAPSPALTVQIPSTEKHVVSGTLSSSGTPATGTTITNVTSAANYDPSASPSGVWYINIIGNSNSGPGSPFLNWTYNGTISSGSATTITLGFVYTIAAAAYDFLITSYPVCWLSGPSVSDGALPTAAVGGAVYVGQVIQAAEGTSSYPADTTIQTTTGTASGNITLSSVPNGTLSNAINYYSIDTFSITIKIPTLTITQKSKVVIAVFRTEVNGTVFYRVTNPQSPLYNDPTTDYVSFTDTSADALIIGNDQLYTTGGELENIAAPAISVASSFKSRAIIIPSESPLSWWYSKEVIPGNPVEFSDSFVNNVDAKIGAITAIGVLDEKIIFFGASSKYYVVGNGPAPSGANNDYSPAQLITGSTGCTNQNSILQLPVGLIYQDPNKGIYLLDRSLQESYIGQDVEQYNNDPVTSAQLIPGTTSLRLTLTSGTVLIYDWFYNQWGADPYQSEVISSTLYSNKFTYVQANGLVQQDTIGTYTDNGSYFSLAPTTGWLSFAGVEGFQRVYELHILGNYKSPHTLTVNIYANFDDSTIKQTTTISVPSDPAPYEFRIRMNDQVSKCTALKINISDSGQSGSGESYSLSSMGFVVGVKQGLNKLPASRSY